MSRYLIAATASVATYSIMSYALDAGAALCGLQSAVWPHVEGAIWIIRIISAVVAGWCGYRALRRTDKWGRDEARRFAGIVLALSAVLVPIAAWWWTMLATTDSDYQLVCPAMVNRRLPDALSLPRSANEVHMLGFRGISPATYLRFRASPQDASEYLDRALSLGEEAKRLQGGEGYVPHLNVEWWRTGREGEWIEISARRIIFIHHDKARDTVYVILRGD